MRYGHSEHYNVVLNVKTKQEVNQNINWWILRKDNNVLMNLACRPQNATNKMNSSLWQ